MGIQMNLPKNDNALYTDFPYAYWCIEDIAFLNNAGESYTRFLFNAYPSRESKQMKNYSLERTLSFGGPAAIAYNPLLHTWECSVHTADLFPNGIPITEKDQKDTIYSYVKERLDLQGYTDIFE